MSEQGHVLFKYVNNMQELEQTFGINIQKYLSAKVMDSVNVEQSGDNYNVRTITEFEKM